MIRILFVDDDPEILAAFQRAFRRDRARWEVVIALGGRAAIEELRSGTFDVVVSDIRMPEIDGLSVLRFAREHSPHTVRIVLSGSEEISSLAGASLVHALLVKPCAISLLRATIERSSPSFAG